MQSETISERFFSVLSSLFNLPPETLSDDSSRATLEQWDSLKHMHLVLALEEEFGIEFRDDEIGDLDTAARLKAAIAKKLGAAES